MFLQTWRSTLIPTITIPVSLVGAFAFIKLMGFSINTLTLFGIILATGIVVDDAIVVIENIERHIQEYQVPAQQAASDAMGEVFGAVIATALVLIAVFVPVAFFPGTTGRLYAQFSMTIAFAVALSAFNALTLTPALSALLLDREHHGKGRVLHVLRARRSPPAPTATSRVLGAAMRLALGDGRWCSSSRSALTVLGLPHGAAGVRARRGPGLLHHAGPGAGRARRSQYTGDIARQAEQILMKDPDVAGAVLGHGLQLQRRGAEPGADVRAAEAVRPAQGRRALARRRCSGA